MLGGLYLWGCSNNIVKYLPHYYCKTVAGPTVVGICHGLLVFSCLMFSEGLLPDALSCKVQTINEIGLGFQQNLLKVDTNIVLYQNLVKDTILQI